MKQRRLAENALQGAAHSSIMQPNPGPRLRRNQTPFHAMPNKTEQKRPFEKNGHRDVGGDRELLLCVGAMNSCVR
jgi:hypothetical protein